MPARENLARICASLASVRHPAEAWRQLVQRAEIPPEWLDDPQRRFIHHSGDEYIYSRKPTRDPMRAPAASHPGRVNECALFAADVGGVTAAGAAARTLVERLAPWGAPPYRHVRWWTLPRERYTYALSDTLPPDANYAPVSMCATVHSIASSYIRGLPSDTYGHARIFAEAWRELAALGVHFPIDTHSTAWYERMGPMVAGRAFAEMPNAFEPLATIEGSGYAMLEWLGSDSEAPGAIVLVSPQD
jgi:hypothetical protein